MDGQSSVESQESIPECRYFFLMKLTHVSITKNFGVFPQQLRFTTGWNESRPFVIDLDSHIEQHVQDEPLKNYPSLSPLFENREALYQSKLKLYPGM